MFLFHRIIKSPLVTFFFGLSTFLISKNINFFYSLLMNLTYHFQRCKNLDPNKPFCKLITLLEVKINNKYFNQ
jgi:hypothetical protein